MKKCIECHREVPEDSNFCPYCGGNAVEEIVNLTKETNIPSKKVCNSCGKEVDSDSVFCPFCGSKDLITETISRNTPAPNMAGIVCPNCKSYISADSNFCPVCHAKVDKVYETKSTPTDVDTNPVLTKKSSLMIPLVVACLVIIVLGFICYQDYTIIQGLNQEINNLNSNNVSLKTQLTTAQNNSNKYQTKASKYDSIISNLNKITGYSDLYANKYILYTPNRETVYITNTNYSAMYASPSGGATSEWGNWSGNSCALKVSYSGGGVGYVKVYPEGRESHAIYIICIGR